MSGPSTRRRIKQEQQEGMASSSGAAGGGGSGFFDSLDILATIATQELKSKSDKEGTPDSDDSERSGRGSSQPRKLAEMESVNLDQIRNMSTTTLLRLFTETDFDEVKRKYCYTCVLLPDQCGVKYQSFGNENKAKKEMRQHLEEHVNKLIKEDKDDFVAEPVIALKKKQKEGVPAVVTKATVVKKKIKNESAEHVKDEPIARKRSNSQESVKKHRIKKETDQLSIVAVESVVTEEVVDEEPAQLVVEVKREQSAAGQSGQYVEAVDPQQQHGPDGERTVVDEDHCYAQPGRVKAEYWPDFVANSGATAFTSIQETDETYDNIKETSHLATVEAIQTCPVMLEEDFQFQHQDMYQQELVIQTTSGVEDAIETVEAVQTIEEVPEQQPEQTEFIVYQEDIGGTEQYYTETIVSENPIIESGNFIKQPVPRIKNKRTVAAVSNEDKRLALNAMEELRARGATTDDLICRLCDPPRPFTAYSTLLTHYRSHAGLRPFECGLCGATFTRQHSLNYHLMTHANQTRFTCPHCNRKFRHPTHYKEHVKKHGEVVQFVCQLCNASLSTQSQFRKHLKMKHNKTIDIMGNVIDSQQELKEKKEREKVRRKRKTNEEEDPNSPSKKRRRNSKKMKEEEERVASSLYFQDYQNTKEEQTEYYEDMGPLLVSNEPHESGTVVYEETIPIAESEQMYKNSELMETQNGTFEIIENNGNVVTVIQSPPPQTSNGALFSDYSETFVVDNTPVVTQSKQTKIAQKSPTQMAPSTPVIVSRSLSAGANQLIAGTTPVLSGQAANPLIFVVPSSGQSPMVTTPSMVTTTKQPVIIQEQKKPIIVSNTAAADLTKINQGVIAQINGQKVLLVPKKKENVETTIKTAIQKIQPAMNVKIATTSIPAQKVVTVKASTVASVVTTGENQENDAENNKVIVDRSNAGILEQAMVEVFPTSLEAEADNKEDDKETDSDLYHPTRSPLKNRNKILCEVVGIDS